jgi:glycosyltransferase involved in cell wall biosynthesis
MEPKGATISANSVEFETDGDEDSGSSSNRVLRSRVFEQFSLSSDPYYNPNFYQGPQQFNIGYNVSSVSEQSRLKIGFVSHNLEREGSPKYLLDLVEGLGGAKNIGAVIYAAANGPLSRNFEAANLPVKIFEAPKNFRRVEGFLKEVDSLAEMFNRDNLDLLVCNTLQSFWAVLAANRAKIPCVLVQHESDSPDTYFRFLPKKLRRMAEGIFSLVFRAVYVSEATREVWRPFHTKNNTVVIEQAVRREKILKTFDSLTKQQARKKLDVGVEEIMVVCIGTISRRKNQKDLIKALEVLEADRTKMLKIFLVGKFGEEDYVEDIKRHINTLPKSVASRILLTGNVEDVAIYLRAADIYVCTSIIESAPRTIVEAMGASLPVISTPVFGIVEMVEENRNCLFYQPGNIHQLAKLIAMLSSDKHMRKRLSEHSQTVFNTFTRFDWMIGHWSDLIQMAVASKSRQNKRAIVRHE